MPQYFFDVHDGHNLTRDTEGTELPNPEVARREAHLTLGHMVKDEMPDSNMRSLYININDDAGVPIYTVCMSMVGRWLGYTASN